jgi:hypothetical protein
VITVGEPIDMSQIPLPPSSSSSHVSRVVLPRAQLPPVGQCLVSQVGTDGFGHQLEGKFSFILFAELHQDKMAFVYLPFTTVDHSDLHGDVINDFVALHKVLPTLADLEKQRGRQMKIQQMQDYSFADQIIKGTFKCEADTIYHSDNLWAYVYSDFFREKLNALLVSGSPTLTRIRTAFAHAPNKPSLNFKPHRPNVVIHMRRGDAVERGTPNIYFNKGIEFYQHYFKQVAGWVEPPFFTIETDDRNWDYIGTLIQTYGADNIALGTDDQQFMSAFNRMVTADGLVTAKSGFSRSAVWMRFPSSVPIVAESSGDYYSKFSQFVYMIN